MEHPSAGSNHNRLETIMADNTVQAGSMLANASYGSLERLEGESSQ